MEPGSEIEHGHDALPGVEKPSETTGVLEKEVRIRSMVSVS